MQVHAIREMKRTKTKEDIKRVLVVINLARFMPHKSVNSKHLRSLLQEDTTYKWST